MSILNKAGLNRATNWSSRKFNVHACHIVAITLGLWNIDKDPQIYNICDYKHKFDQELVAEFVNLSSIYLSRKNIL